MVDFSMFVGACRKGLMMTTTPRTTGSATAPTQQQQQQHSSVCQMDAAAAASLLQLPLLQETAIGAAPAGQSMCPLVTVT
jgi:hypothetical protein